MDSLGDLSEFEDADFEAFADSLLDDGTLDDELFGVQMRRTNPDFVGGSQFGNHISCFMT